MHHGFASALIPAFSPRRRRIVRRFLGISRAAIAESAVSYVNQTRAFPSPGGEGQGALLLK